MRRIREIVRKEFLQLRRDRRLLPLLFLAPVIQLILLGYAATTDLKDVPVAVCDMSRSAASRELIRAFTAHGDFRVRVFVDRIEALDWLLDANRVDVALVIPPDYAEKIATGATAPVQVLVDGSKVNATIALNQMAAAIAQHAQGVLLTKARTRGLAMRTPGADAHIRVWYNPELSSRNFMVPGVLATILMIITTVITSMAIVKERETGTIEQIIVTPIRSTELLTGKLVPFAIIGFVEVLLVLTVAVLWFRVPLRGNGALLLALSMLFMLNAQGLGLFISTVSHTQQQAMMTAVFFVILPMLMLSGFIFPIEHMPKAVQYVTYLLPLRYFLVILRGIFLKGVGWSILWPQVLALAIFGTAIFALAAVRFQKRIG